MPEITNADNTVVSVPKKQKVRKQTYCKKCGSLIDNKTKKCEGCGKQYFHLPEATEKHLFIAVIIAGLLALNIYQYVVNQQIVEQLNKDLSSMTESKDDLLNQREKLSKELMSKDIELMYWDNHAVIVTEAGKKYHHYGCYHLNDCTSFWIYNTEAAKSRGYTPCLDCCGLLEQMDNGN